MSPALLLALAALLAASAGMSFQMPLPSGIRRSDLRPLLRRFGLQPRSQGGRGTCSVFAVVGALEYAVARKTGRGVPLSAEYLNWAGHHATGRTADGGFFHELWAGFAADGVCPESDLPYRAAYDPGIKPDETAKQHAAPIKALGLDLTWIKEWDVRNGLTAAHMKGIKDALKREYPVFCGLRWPKQERWKDGVLQLCPPDQVFDGHSILIVGCQDDPAQPGGGTFLIWNSGGGSREGALPYAYVQEYANDAAWIGIGSSSAGAGGPGGRT